MSIVQIVNGDCLTVLKALPDACFDSVVTDPPAGIGFMGKAWDGDKGGRNQWIAWLSEVMGECLRVLKPGGHALVWALPRTSHWTATAVEDAGFEIRDCIVHLFGSGFPKSLDVSKAIDKAAGAERTEGARQWTGGQRSSGILGDNHGTQTLTKFDTPATAAAAVWQGWGTALKPAAEHWILARKPLIGTVAANVTEYGTGAINVDGCRIAATGTEPNARASKTIEGKPFSRNAFGAETGDGDGWSGVKGRWPANVTLDEEAAEALDAQSGTSKTPSKVTRGANRNQAFGMGEQREVPCYGDSGGASRFFYVAKPSTKERDAGLEEWEEKAWVQFQTANGTSGKASSISAGRDTKRRNTHPTVKPIALMRYLCRLITPPGGIVLDPFCGSGTTGCAAVLEGFGFVGIEMDAEHVATAEARIAHWAATAEKEAA